MHIKDPTKHGAKAWFQNLMKNIYGRKHLHAISKKYLWFNVIYVYNYIHH